MSGTIPFASYLPESQIIRLSENIPAFDDPENINGFENPIAFGVFFHEWIHFVHNVSTFNGLCLFVQQVVLWSNFRWVMNDEKLSGGAAMLDEVAANDNKRMYNYIKYCRINNNSRNTINYNSAELLSFVLCEAETSGQQLIKPSLIRCRVSCNNQQHDINIGNLEIIESIAYMLESKLVSDMGDNVCEAPFSPYHLVRFLAEKAYPSLSDMDVICCILASLQQNDVPAALFTYLKDLEHISANERKDGLIKIVKLFLDEQKELIDIIINQVRQMFPVDEPMGNAIEMALKRIEKNIGFRREEPFFELSIIETLHKDMSSMDSIIKKYGACTVIQERVGDHDHFQRDVMYEFAVDKCDKDEIFGWKMIRSAFHFMMNHFVNSGEIVSTEKLKTLDRPGKKCPFYTVCDYGYRKESGNICYSSPWDAFAVSGYNCYYAAGLKATNPPPPSESL